MSTKKEIRNFLHEYFKESLRGRVDKPYNRKIYLTDKDYVEVEITKTFHFLVIGLYFDNRECNIVYAGGTTGDLDGVWRRFRNAFKRRIAEEERFEWDAKFLARLKEAYRLL